MTESWSLYPGSDEMPDDPLQVALVTFVGCIAEAVPDICSYGLTLGESYVPFSPDEDEECGEEDAACSQMWVRVTGVNPTAEQAWGGDCAVELRVGLEVGVLRCIEVPEDGEAPTASDVLVASLQSMTDMKAIHCAAMGCEEAFDVLESGQWTPLGPLGGQYGGMWTFTATVT